MKFALYTIRVSPHQLPLAQELVNRLGPENFRYVHREPLTQLRRNCGWSDVVEPWIVQATYGDGVADEILENCDVLLSGQRDLKLFEKRAGKGFRTFYQSERWFKPITVFEQHMVGGLGLMVPGRTRLLMPSYRRMAKRFVRWMNSDPNARCLTIGPWAKVDMLSLGIREEKLVPWGYFVAPSDHETNLPCQPQPATSTSLPLRVLWVGRMVYLKRIDTIIRAVKEALRASRYQPQLCGPTVSLTLVGDGPEKSRLQRMVSKLGMNDFVFFIPSQPIGKVREIMRDHDVFVFASNARDGWGAVVNEALEEGLVAIGTSETGAGATLLAKEWQFNSGDYQRLADLIRKCVEMKMTFMLHGQGIGGWSAKNAAERLFELSKESIVGN